MMEKIELPAGWAWTNLQAVSDTVFGQSPPSSSYNQDGHGLPFFQGKAEFGELNPTARKWCTEPTREAMPGDILLSIRAPVGPTNVADCHCAIGRGLAALRPRIDPKYVRYWLIKSEPDLESKGTGTTFSAISKGVVNSHPIPTAPLSEQLRIVDKVESLFAQLDHGEASLRDVQKLLARYRQSVLKAAVTGQLTADWRAENADRLEPGHDLLERILQARRENWQGRGKYKEPVAADTSELPELPEGWIWVTLGALITNGPQNGVYFPQSKYGSGTPILRIDDYQIGWVRSRGDLRVVGADCEEVDKYALESGDFVVNRVNSVSHLGKVALVSKEHEGVLFESNMMRFSVSCEISKEYLYFYLSSFLGKRYLIKNCKHAVNQASINQGDVSSTPVPLPPLFEQEEIAQRLAEESSRELSTKHWCQTELTRSAALRQSILKDAFAGKLVPQDSDDEPASELLARIRAERDAAAPKKRTRKKVTA